MLLEMILFAVTNKKQSVANILTNILLHSEQNVAGNIPVFSSRELALP